MLYKLTNDNQSHLLGTNNQTFPNPCHPHAPSKKICLGKKYDFSEIGRGINFTLVERKIPLVPKKSLVIFCGGDLPPAAVSKQREEKKERRRRRREKKGKKAEAVACLECGGKVSKDGKRRRGGGQETRSLLSVSLVFRPSCWHASAQFRLTTTKKRYRTERTISGG